MLKFLSKLINYPFQVVYRIWFYLLMGLPLLLFFPLLIILTAHARFYPAFYWIARNIWANLVLYGIGCVPRIRREEHLELGKSYMLVANHTSMTDVMLMLRVSRNPFVFVGKKELVKIPIFGYVYKRVSIMVDRDSARSRSAVYQRAKARLNEGLSVCIFPEGGVPEYEVELDEFRNGAFNLAIEHQIPIVPMTFLDNKKRLPYVLHKGGPGLLRVKVHPFIETRGLGVDERDALKQKCRNIIATDLS